MAVADEGCEFWRCGGHEGICWGTIAKRGRSSSAGCRVGVACGGGRTCNSSGIGGILDVLVGGGIGCWCRPGCVVAGLARVLRELILGGRVIVREGHEAD